MSGCDSLGECESLVGLVDLYIVADRRVTSTDVGFNDAIRGPRSVADRERIDIDSKPCVIRYTKMPSAGYDVKLYGGEMNA